MHFLMPNVFPLANDFVLNDPDQEAKIKELHNKLKEYMLRRLRTEVIKSLPTKTERILRVDLSSQRSSDSPRRRRHRSICILHVISS